MKIELSEISKRRSSIKDVFEAPEKKVCIAGWVDNVRELGKIRFLLLKDSSGKIQVTAIKEKVKNEIFEIMSKIPRESVIYIEGNTKKSKQAPGGKEIIPEILVVLNFSEEKLPIDVSEFTKTELPKRIDNRFLDLHRNKIHAIFKIQSEITHNFRKFFRDQNFTEVQLPSIISSSSEGGTDLFEVNYFNKRAYLAQSPQLYKQMLASSLMEKVFTITPVWRAEKHNTIRHLNESRQMDIEVAFSGQKEVMKYLEETIKYIVKNILENCKKELDLLNLKLKIPKVKYFSYDKIVELLDVEWGEDLSPENEKNLSEKFPDTIIFIHSWPSEIKPFYIMPKDQNPKAKLSEGFDAIYKGLEISSGGQRIHLPKLLIESLKIKNLDPSHFKEYIDSFRFGAPPHSGWSIGLERITMALLDLPNIREAVLFPRDRDRLAP